MKILVTGSSGQLARSLIERAATLTECQLLAVGRRQLDLEAPGSAERVIREIMPDIVINAAAMTDVDGAEEERLRAHRINADAAGEVAAAATQIGARVIQISTDYVFDGTKPEPYDESDPTGPINSYGRSKLAGEKAVQAATADHLIMRTSWVYSPFGRNFVKSMFEAANDREELRVITDKRGSPTSALDLADALLVIVDRWADDRTGLGNIYHVAGSGSASWYDLAEEVMRQRAQSGLQAARVMPIPASDWPMRAARPDNSVLDCSKFARDFGFRMPDWRSSVADTVRRLASLQ